MHRRLLLVAGGGGSFTIPAPLVPALSGSRVDVMTGTGYKAFPGMTLRSGRLHLVYRYGTAHNSGADSEIDYKYSDDDGATWSNPGSAITLVGPTTGTDDLRDPAIVALASGRLLCVYDTRNPYTGTAIHAKAIYSDDGGSTWSSAYTIPGSYSNDIVTSQPIELASGDILIPMFGESGSLVYTSYVMRSTDDGATFGSEVTVASGANDYQEPQVRELASGRIVCLLRSEATHHTYRSYSDDDGATWSSPAYVNDMTGRPDFVEITPGVLIQVGRYLTSGDSPLYWAYSTDDGATWTTPTELDTGGTAYGEYSAPVVTADGEVTMVYSLENSSSDADLYLRRFVLV